MFLKGQKMILADLADEEQDYEVKRPRLSQENEENSNSSERKVEGENKKTHQKQTKTAKTVAKEENCRGKLKRKVSAYVRRSS